MYRRFPGRKFTIARRDDRRAKRRELRVAPGIVGEDLFDGRAVTQLVGIFADTDKLFQSAEK